MTDLSEIGDPAPPIAPVRRPDHGTERIVAAGGNDARERQPVARHRQPAARAQRIHCRVAGRHRRFEIRRRREERTCDRAAMPLGPVRHRDHPAAVGDEDHRPVEARGSRSMAATRAAQSRSSRPIGGTVRTAPAAASRAARASASARRHGRASPARRAPPPAIPVPLTPRAAGSRAGSTCGSARSRSWRVSRRRPCRTRRSGRCAALPCRSPLRARTRARCAPAARSA